MGFQSKLSYNTLMEEEPKIVSPSNSTPQSVPQETPQINVDQPESIITGTETPTEAPGEHYVTWSAVEFIEHKKSFSWFLILGLVFIIIATAVYFIVHSVFPSIMVILIGIAFAVIGGRPPRVLDYVLSSSGIKIGERFISYNEFKSFSIIDENTNLSSISFNPLKRFTFPVTIYFDQINEDKILSLLMQFLPHEEAPNDPIDQLMRKLHF